MKMSVPIERGIDLVRPSAARAGNKTTSRQPQATAGRRHTSRHCHRFSPYRPLQTSGVGFMLTILWSLFIDAQTMQISPRQAPRRVCGQHQCGGRRPAGGRQNEHRSNSRRPLEGAGSGAHQDPQQRRRAFQPRAPLDRCSRRMRTAKPVGDLASAIDKDLGGFDNFKKNFTTAATGVFGSGWAWFDLPGWQSCRSRPCPTRTARSPAPRPRLLGLDVWEHAYYLKYQNVACQLHRRVFQRHQLGCRQ